MNLSSGDKSRYREFRSHLVPRTRVGRAVIIAFSVLFLCGQWPVTSLVNRDEPTIFGLPFFFVFLAGVYAAQIAVLIYGARRRL